jgi:hypothetical protein
MGEWLRARRAYRALVAPVDPAADVVEAGAVDLRPGGPVTADGRRVVVSGPDDLVELVRAVESVTGPGTWPGAATDGVEPTGERRRARLALERPAQALALVAAMEGLVVDRTGAWRTWRTTLEAVAAAVSSIDSLTVEAVILDP